MVRRCTVPMRRGALPVLALALATALLVPTARQGSFAAMPEVTEEDLLVVGAGYLGRRVAKLWQSQKPQAKVVAATLTETNHEALRNEGLEPILAEDLKASKMKFAQVVYCAPPSRTADYAESVAEAVQHVASGGIVVFTSSASVFAEDDGNAVDESGSLSESSSAQRMLQAEEAARSAGSGAVLRLAGLYDLERGPHSYWLKVGIRVANTAIRQVLAIPGVIMMAGWKGAPEGLINLVHYEDAASAVVSALEAKKPEVYVISDGVPISRREICTAAVQSKHFAGKAMPTFEAPAELPMGGAHGKRLDASKARQQLGWRPKFGSFAEYMAAH
eukprot:symbB.v1.2.021204.t1/scaffold1803.1/size100779/3